MKRSVAFLVCLLMILGNLAVPGSSLAEEAEPDVIITPFYVYISKIEAGLSINGSTAYCTGKVSSSSSYDISITMTLKRTGGSSWSDVKSWSGSGSGITGALLDKTYTIIPGDYKIVVVGKIINSNGTVLETATKESGIKTYR